MNWIRSSKTSLDLPSVPKQNSWIKKSMPHVNREKTGVFRYWADGFQFWLNDVKQIIKKPTLVSDISAGITVAAVALPLNLALAVASGLPASSGIIAGAIGGFAAGLLGGSRWQVTGPAAALNVMVFTIVQQYGPAGAAAAALFTGASSLLLSFFGMGKWIAKIPEAVIAGFTTGVGLKLLDQQLPHLLGVQLEVSEMLTTLHQPEWLQSVSWYEVLCGLGVIFFVLALKSIPRIPGALIGLALITFVSSYLNWDLKRVGELSGVFPPFTLPDLKGSQWGSLFLLSLPLVLLASVESLLSARVIDRMEPKAKPHHANQELFGQGIANTIVGFFSGMPVTGVVVRSTVNVQSGGKTRVAAMVHGVVLLVAFMYFSGALAQIPIAALAGLLCLIGFRLVEIHHLFHLVKSHRLEALSFTIAAIGTLNNKLFLGLVSAILLIVIGRAISNRLKVGDEYAESDDDTVEGRRAVIQEAHAPRHDWRVQYATQGGSEPWVVHVGETPVFFPTSYVHPNATVIGRVIVGRQAHIAAETSIRADEGTPFYIGERTNLQDGVVLHALKEKFVEVQGKKWAIYIDQRVSVAHQALVHGPCFVGARTFIGFKSIVHDSVVGPDCFIGHGAIVVGVEVPPGRFVPHGAIIDTQEKARELSMALDQHHHFNEDVVEVNEGLAKAYQWIDMKKSENEKNQENHKENLTWNQQSSASGTDSSRVSYF